MPNARNEGIEVRHTRACRSRTGGRCTCKPGYRAAVWSERDGKRIKKTFPTLSAAKGWRADAQVALRSGALRAPSPHSVRQAADAWLEGAKVGSVRNRSGDTFKPSVIRGYEQALRDRVLPVLGSFKLSDLRRPDVQELADKSVAEGHNPSTVRNALMPLRALYRWHLARGDVAVNPTTCIELPAACGRRDRIVSPDKGARLLAALPASERALWATALYAGLRLGELRGLRWEDVNLAGGTIRRRALLGCKGGNHRAEEPRRVAGESQFVAALRDHLVEHRMRQGREIGLVFGRTEVVPFGLSTAYERSRKAWDAVKLDGITFHEARHTFASILIAAGVNAKAICTYMGHSSITVTYDKYGHLMPGSESEAIGLVDAYLERADTQARLAKVAS